MLGPAAVEILVEEDVEVGYCACGESGVEEEGEVGRKDVCGLGAAQVQTGWDG